MPLIRTRADIDDKLGGPLPAEVELMAACEAGERCSLGHGTLPAAGDASREVRADVLRYLILGGCDECPVADWGVRVTGAFVSGDLDLSFASAKGVTGLAACRFQNQIEALQTGFELFNLSDSHLTGLNAQGAQITRHAFLRNITATAPITFGGAEIGGQLSCNGAQLNATDGFALNAEGAQITGDAVLNNITATATITFSGAKIGGQLSCEGAHLNATKGFALNAHSAQITGGAFLENIIATAPITFSGAEIGGWLSCDGAHLNATDGFALNAERARIIGDAFLRGITATAPITFIGTEIGGQLICNGAQLNATKGFALNAQGAQISGGLFWHNVKHPSRPVSFVAAHTRVLADDFESWDRSAGYALDGFTYDRIYDSTDARQRIAWLEKGNYRRKTFAPQPFTQLAKVLRDMGHDGEARKVLFRREQLLRQNQRDLQRITPDGDLSTGLRSIWRDVANIGRYLFDLLLRLVVGYGHRPFRSLIALAVLIIMSVVPAHFAWEEGSFAPNSGPVLVSRGWLDLQATGDNPAAVWSGEATPAAWIPPDDETAWVEIAPGRDWETFNRYAYAADVVIPIIDIGQTSAWAPSTTRGWWGWHLWWLKGVLSVAGWIVTALGAAAITGIIRRE